MGKSITPQLPSCPITEISCCRLGECYYRKWQGNGNNGGISDTELYKNQFRLSTLRHLQKTCGVKNPIPKDERVALLHYHPLVRQELRWTKNTPASQKYKISPQLASTIPNMNINEDRCLGLNIDKCYIVPTYDFNIAKAPNGNASDATYSAGEPRATISSIRSAARSRM